MNRPWDDCKFYLTSGCRNQHCKFRHSELAKNAEMTCNDWLSGKCTEVKCPRKHFQSLDSVLCRFEFAPGGCRNSACPFQHTIKSQKGDPDLQKKLALFLAEHDEKTKSNNEAVIPKERKDSISSGSSAEVDLAALRAEALRTKVKNEKTVIKRKSNETAQVIPAKKIKNENQLKNIQINRKVNDDNNRRIITKREYSEDEVSDISLDELTDEEPEDLRATLNKNKNQIARISNPNPQNSGRRLIKKVETKQSPTKDRSRLITLRKTKDEENSDSRPSSSEWIERKISVKQSSTKGQINRLIAQVNRSSESDYSDAQSDDSSKRKRKPNNTWANIQHNETTEEPYNRKISYEDNNDVSFKRKITVSKPNAVSIKSRLNTTNIKSRLGLQNKEETNSIKKRIGVKNVKDRLGLAIPKKETIASKSPERLNDQPKKKKIILLKQKKTIDSENSSLQPKENKVETKKVEIPKKLESPIRATITKPSSPVRTQKSISKSSLGDDADLEDELLGEIDDDLILGNDDIDDELFL